MPGKQRTVYFMEAVEEDGPSSVRPYEAGFWQSYHELAADASMGDRLMTFYGRRYSGWAKVERSPAVSYLYLGRSRSRADFPDHAVNDGDAGPLEIDGNLLEWMYVVEVGGTNIAAFMRSSAGPTFEAFERWVNQVLDRGDGVPRFGLRPYVRGDARERLADALGVSKLHVKYDPHSMPAKPDRTGQIKSALREVERIAGGAGVTIELTVSFGQASPSEAGAEGYARELQDLLSTPGLVKAEATLLKPATGHEARRPRNDMVREHVDFIRDRVAYQVEVGETEDERPTSNVVLRAIGEAIAKFREDYGG